MQPRMHARAHTHTHTHTHNEEQMCLYLNRPPQANYKSDKNVQENVDPFMGTVHASISRATHGSGVAPVSKVAPKIAVVALSGWPSTKTIMSQI